MYISFSADKAFLYNIKYLYFVSQSVITRIELYFIFISDFFNFESFTIKFKIILTYNYFNIFSDFSNLYSLY